jgi:hypothetical protein
MENELGEGGRRIGFMGERRNAHNILVGQLKERSEHVGKVGCEDMEYIETSAGLL